MTKDSESNKYGGPKVERRKKMRRVGKDRRDQVRWGDEHQIRRKGPGRRALDRLLRALDFMKK